MGSNVKRMKFVFARQTALAVVLACAATTARADVERVEVYDRVLVADGKAFGNVGPYERLRGRLTFTIYPNWLPGKIYLGSGLIVYSQKMTVAAMQMADMKVWAHRS